MKSVLLSLFVLMLAAGVSPAEQTQQPSRYDRVSRGRAMQSSGMGKYSGMLENMANVAEGMDISAEQKEKISKIRIDYIDPMKTEESQFRKLHSQIMKMVEDPAFDAAAVKKEIEKADEVNKKIADKYIDGLASIRDTLGAEKYTELNKSAYQYRHELIQMRTNQTDEQQSGRYRDKQTPEPEAADDAQDADNKE